MTSKIRLAAVALAALSVGTATLAQQGRPEGPPLDKIAADLQISEEALQSCLPQPEQGSRPARPDMDTVVPCLQKANPSLTAATVEEVMQKYGPPQRGN